MTIKETLKQAGIYTDKLDHQIELATQLKRECVMYRKAIKETGYLIEGKNGKVVNPLIASLQKAEGLLQSAYTSLGLTYSLKPDNLPPSDENKKQSLTELIDL